MQIISVMKGTVYNYLFIFMFVYFAATYLPGHLYCSLFI